MPQMLRDPEDAKLLTLARANRARVGAVESAAVRDIDGRTYSAADVNLPSLQLSALQSAVAMAVSSGVQGLEAAVLVSDNVGIADADLAVLRDFAGSGVTVHRADSSGEVVESVTT